MLKLTLLGCSSIMLMFNQGKSRATVLINLFTIVIGTIVMAGWAFHIPVLKQIVPGFVYMVFNTALCFILFSIALLSAQYPANKYRDALYFITSFTGTLIGFITLLQFLFNFNTGLDELFVKDPAKISSEHLYAGRMAFNTAITVVLFGAGLLMITSRKRLFILIGQYLFHAVSIIAAVALIGYLYGVSLFHSLLYVSSMAAHTAILFFMLSIIASLLNPSVGITSLFTGNRIGNKMARRLFGLILLVVVVCGSIRLQTAHYALLSSGLGISILVICFLLTSLLIIGNTAIWLNRIDLKRSEAEAEVKLMNAELEKRVEERSAEIQKSEAKYRSLISQASDAIYLLDLNANFIDVNDSMCAMVGYSSDELLRMNVKDIMDPEELKRDPLPAKMAQAKALIRERRFMRKDGCVFTVEVNVKVFPGNMVLVMARDISDRKKMETELREAELKFRTIADKSIVGVYILQHGKFIYVNPRFAEIFGYEPEELTGIDPLSTIIHENYHNIAKENIRKRIQGEVPGMHYEAMGLKKDGSTNWVEFYGNSVSINNEPTIIGTMLDITERKEAENIILKEKILSDTIINSLPGIFYLLTEDGRYLRWNYNFERIMGYNAEEIEHLHVMQLVAPEDCELIVETIEKVFIEGYSVVEAHGLTKNGKKIPFILTGIPVLYEGQRCLLGTGIDISLRIKAEEELRSSEQKYKLLFESSPLPLWMIAKNDLTIIAANNAAARLYGYTREELINKSITIIREQHDRTRALMRSEEGALTDVTDLGIIRHQKKDGAPMYVNVIANDIIFEGREVRLSFTNDVTERLKAEESLQKSEANLKTILNTTDTAYALLDMELKVLAFNQKAIEFVQLNYRHTPEKGDLLSDFFPAERFPQFLDLIREVFKGNSVNYEIDYPQINGAIFWYDVHLSPIIDDNKRILGMLMALYDITDRKVNEQNLQNAYKRIQDHIESIKGMAWKQSHLMRSPLANLKALADILKGQPADPEAMRHFQTELARMDAIIHEMAAEASEHER